MGIVLCGAFAQVVLTYYCFALLTLFDLIGQLHYLISLLYFFCANFSFTDIFSEVTHVSLALTRFEFSKAKYFPELNITLL